MRPVESVRKSLSSDASVRGKNTGSTNRANASRLRKGDNTACSAPLRRLSFSGIAGTRRRCDGGQTLPKRSPGTRPRALGTTALRDGNASFADLPRLVPARLRPKPSHSGIAPFFGVILNEAYPSKTTLVRCRSYVRHRVLNKKRLQPP